MIERKIGEIFFARGKKLLCVEGLECDGCASYQGGVCTIHLEETGYCGKLLRTDKKSVIFVEIPDGKEVGND